MEDAEKLLFLNIETLATIAESAAPLKRKRGRPRKHAGFDGLGYYPESGAQSSHYDSSGSAESSQLPPIEMPPYEEENDQDFEDSMMGKNDDQPAQKRGRGRPPKVKRLGEIEELMQLDKSAGGTMYSVRRVPCYYAKCTHSYRRPNSTIVEFSDRPLVLPDKYSGYAIRSCKKHHDWWKNKKDVGPNSCEICRGLNADDSTVSNITNNRGIVFKICKVCAEKQADTLGLPMEIKRSNGTDIPLSSDTGIESPSGGSPMFAQGGRPSSPQTEAPVAPTPASYSRMNITPAPSLNVLAQEVIKNPQPLDLKELVAKITERSPEQTQNTQKLQRIERELERIQSQHVQREKEIQRMRQFMPELLFQNIHHDDDGDGGEHSNEDIDISETDSDPSSDFDPNFMANNPQSHLPSRATSQKDNLEFFGSSRCPFSQRIWITLLEKGLKFSFHNVSARNGKKDGIKESGLQDKEWYWMFQFNPQGHSTIPIIKHNNRTLYESTSCAEYIDEVFPQKKLMPEPAYEKSQIRLIVLFVNTEIVPLFYKILLERDSASCAQLQQQLLDCLIQAFNLTSLSARGPYLGGAEFTLADIALLPFFERFQTVLPQLTGFQIPQTEEYDRLRKWYQTCKDRPSFVKTIPSAEVTEQIIKAYSSYKTTQQSN